MSLNKVSEPITRWRLPVVYNKDAWDAQLKGKLTKNYVSEDLAIAFTEFHVNYPSAHREIAYLWREIEVRCQRFLSAGLRGLPKSKLEATKEEALGKLKEGLCKPNSSISRGLQTFFDQTLRGRKLDAIKKNKREEFADIEKLKENELPFEHGDAEFTLRLSDILRQTLNKNHRDALIYMVTNVEPKNILRGMSISAFVDRYLYAMRAEVRTIIDIENSRFYSSIDNHKADEDEMKISMLPGITERDICRLVFQVDSPNATDADVAYWSGLHPKYADDFQSLAEMIRSEKLEEGEAAA